MRNHWSLVAAFVAAIALPLQAQLPDVEIDDDELTINGCITPMSVPAPSRPDLLIWSRGDIMLAGAAALTPSARGSRDLTNRVFYWLEDDDDLSKHAGQRVEVKGELEDFEEGEIEIERDDDFAEIRLKLDGRTEDARVPISWLGPGTADHDVTVEFVARKIEVEDVRVLGPCGRSRTNF